MNNESIYSNTKTPTIIEFYGLPGCGKTTLSDTLSLKYKMNEVKVAVINDVTSLCSFLHVMRVFRLRDLLAFIGLFFYYLKNGVAFNYAFAPFRRLLIYRCIKKYSDYDYVFIDHGVIQSFVSALYELRGTFEIDNDSKYRRFLTVVPVDKYVYCKISSEKSYERIKIRDRKDSGRLDQKPQKTLLELLSAQCDQFDSFDRLLYDMKKAVYSINCNGTPEECLNQAIKVVE